MNMNSELDFAWNDSDNNITSFVNLFPQDLPLPYLSWGLLVHVHKCYGSKLIIKKYIPVLQQVIILTIIHPLQEIPERSKEWQPHQAFTAYLDAWLYLEA